MTDYIGLYKCRQCGERFSQGLTKIQAPTARIALQQVDQVVPCRCQKMHDHGEIFGFAEVIGVVQATDKDMMWRAV